jgi:hypothetical protein
MDVSGVQSSTAIESVKSPNVYKQPVFKYTVVSNGHIIVGATVSIIVTFTLSIILQPGA